MSQAAFRYYKVNINDTYSHHSLRLFGFSVWAFYYHDGFGWFRIFEKGLKWKDITKYQLLFSERYGHTKAITIGRWRMSLLN